MMRAASRSWNVCSARSPTSGPRTSASERRASMHSRDELRAFRREARSIRRSKSHGFSRRCPVQPARARYITLPVVHGESAGSAWATLLPILESMQPDAVVALGESAKADRVHFERVAVNLRDARVRRQRGRATRRRNCRR
jgi:hypothetical protein